MPQTVSNDQMYDVVARARLVASRPSLPGLNRNSLSQLEQAKMIMQIEVTPRSLYVTNFPATMIAYDYSIGC